LRETNFREESQSNKRAAFSPLRRLVFFCGFDFEKASLIWPAPGSRSSLFYSPSNSLFAVFSSLAQLLLRQVIAVKDFELSFWDESLVFFDFLFAFRSLSPSHRILRPDSRKSRSDSTESEGLHRIERAGR
jgi:hypothetical protein